MASKSYRVGVVGAGVVGLSTAVQIQESLPSSAQVTIIADKFDRDTTSDGAAGVFRPTAEVVKGVQPELFRKWTKDSFDFYHKIAHSSEAVQAGITLISGYHFYIDEPYEEELQFYKDVVYNYRHCTQKELDSFPRTSGAKCGIHYTTLLVEGRWFLPFLMKRFLGKGGCIEARKLQSLEELVGRYDVVVNCSGGGSAELIGDSKVIPCRGQVIRAKAPWVKQFFFVDEEMYIIPGRETVIVGGTRQFGDYDVTIRSSDRDRIWKDACTYMPSLEGATWEWEWVGLRPSRIPLRLEKEKMTFKNGSVQVVHNYGHGGEGVGLAWGTGKHACQVVCEILSSSSSAKL